MTTTIQGEAELRKHRHARRRRCRGVSLVEVLIVVSIMALISTGIGFVVVNQMEKARRRTTVTRAQALRGVAEAHMALVASDCPSPLELVERGDLEEDNLRDGWDQPFSVACEGIRITVHSNDGDRQPGTDDDIYVPVSRAVGLNH